MPIFTTPVTVVTDRTFDFISQTSDAKSIIGRWDEFDAALTNPSGLLTKQSRKRDVIRTLVSQKIVQTLDPVPVSGSGTVPSVWNLSYVGDQRLSEVQAQEGLTILLALAAESNFVRNVLHGAV